MESKFINDRLVPSNTKAVVLDWDDTVVGTIKAKMGQHIYVAQEHYGIALDPKEMRKDWGKPLFQLIEKWYQIEPGNVDQYDSVLKTVLSYSARFPKKTFRGASQALALLRERGLRLGVVTGSPHNDLFHDFTHTNLTKEMFDYFQASDDSDYHKPDPRVFDPTKELWLDPLKIAPSDVLYLGDSLRDYEAARDAGFMFLGVETATIDMPTFYQAGALSIRSLGHITKQSK